MSGAVQIDLDTIGEEGLTVDQPLTARWMADALAPDRTFVPCADGHVRVRLFRGDDTVVIDGHVSMPLTTQCSRCAVPIDLSDQTPVAVTLVPEAVMAEAGDDGELTEEQVSVGTYRDHTIDLLGVLHDEVLLHLPMHPLCQDACRGLCPRCGTNLNQQTCACDGVPETNPFGVLVNRAAAHVTKKDV